jgi:hypothetical protein
MPLLDHFPPPVKGMAHGAVAPLPILVLAELAENERAVGEFLIAARFP